MLIKRPLQYLCLENPTDRGALQATVHRVTKSYRFRHFVHKETRSPWNWTAPSTVGSLHSCLSSCCYSECGPWTISECATWEFIKMQTPGPRPRPSKAECFHCAGFSLFAASRGYSLVAVHGLLISVAFCGALALGSVGFSKYGSQALECRLNSCGAWV